LSTESILHIYLMHSLLTKYWINVRDEAFYMITVHFPSLFTLPLWSEQ
jgi:hypothetical protein